MRIKQDEPRTQCSGVFGKQMDHKILQHHSTVGFSSRVQSNPSIIFVLGVPSNNKLFGHMSLTRFRAIDILCDKC